MIHALLAAAVVLFILIFAEFARKKNWLEGEASRKFVHIAVAGFVSTWPFYMSFRLIELMSLLLLAVVLISKQRNIFQSIHSVERKGWGEALFAIGIGLTALISPNQWIFAAALLHVSLADGLAAVVGSQANRKSIYTVFGENRSFKGTRAFLLMSILIIAWVVLAVPSGLHQNLTILWLPPLATTLENFSVYGTDNLTVPVFISLVLSALR